MDLFAKFVAAILIDLTKAQHQSNEFSALLSEEYTHSKGNLKYFPVPNSLINKFEFTVNFAIDEWITLLDEDLRLGLEKTLGKIAEDLPSRLFDAGTLTARIAQLLENEIYSIDPNLVEQQRQESKTPVGFSRKDLIQLLCKRITHNVMTMLGKYLKPAELEANWIQNYPVTILAYLDENLPDFASAAQYFEQHYKAVLDMERLQGAAFINGIKIHVDMRNFDWAYFSKNDENAPVNRLIQRP